MYEYLLRACIENGLCFQFLPTVTVRLVWMGSSSGSRGGEGGGSSLPPSPFVTHSQARKTSPSSFDRFSQADINLTLERCEYGDPTNSESFLWAASCRSSLRGSSTLSLLGLAAHPHPPEPKVQRSATASLALHFCYLCRSLRRPLSSAHWQVYNFSLSFFSNVSAPALVAS